MKDKKLLTQEEVNNLKEGTKVLISWPFHGDDWYEYEIHKRENSELSYCKEHNPNHGWTDGEIDFVGTDKMHTKVKLR